MTKALPILVLLSLLVSPVRADTVVPPRLASGQHVHAPYPPAAAPGATARVILEIVVDPEGAVLEQQPVETRMVPDTTPPDPFVQSALEHARTLRFEPALRDGAPVAAAIRIELIIGLDHAHTSPLPQPAPATVPQHVHPPDHQHPARAVPQTPGPHAFSAHAETGPPTAGRRSAASDLDIEIGALRAVPRRTAQDYLTLAPGVVLQNHSGIGHAGSMYLRGFDAGEGQDLEVIVDGMPINEPSNPHAHGYADTQFLIPEVVERVRVLEGPFDPRQGDFAIAGSAQYALGVSERGLRAQLGYGSYDEQRALLLWAPAGASTGTFAAVDLRRGDGFGPNRAHSSASALARYAGAHGPLHYSLLVGSHALGFDSAGVVRADQFTARELPCDRDPDSQFFCVVDPNQGGSASRHLWNGRLSWQRPDRSYELQIFGNLRQLRIREDFTGDLLDARGDGLDQGYETGTVGVRAAYRLTPRLWGRRQRFEVGLDARHDRGETRLWRLRKSSGIPYETLFDRGLALTHVGAYLRGELAPTPWLTLLGGVRLDSFAFSTENLAAPESDRVGPRLPRDARDAWGSAMSPRGGATFHLSRALDWTVSAGLGVRSSDAQALSEGEDAPFARAVSLETGPSARFALIHDTALEARAFAFAVAVEDDLLFDSERGRNLPIGPSHRYGASASARARIGSQHDTLLSVTWTEAHRVDRTTSLLDLGAGTTLPFVPRLVGRLDHASHAEVTVAGERLQLGAAAGLGWVGPRPLPLGTESESIWQLDVALSARARFLELGFSIENLFDRRNHAAEFNYPSHFGDDAGVRSQRATRHFAAGAPRLWLLTLTAYIDDVDPAAGGTS